MKQQSADLAVESDRRIVGRVGWLGALGLGASQILALLLPAVIGWLGFGGSFGGSGWSTESLNQ